MPDLIKPSQVQNAPSRLTSQTSSPSLEPLQGGRRIYLVESIAIRTALMVDKPSSVFNAGVYTSLCLVGPKNELLQVVVGGDD